MCTDRLGPPEIETIALRPRRPLSISLAPSLDTLSFTAEIPPPRRYRPLAMITAFPERRLPERDRGAAVTFALPAQRVGQPIFTTSPPGR